LPAVDTGAIFEALSSATSGLPKVELTRNYRFSQSSGMGALADAVKQGDTATAQRLLDTEATATCRMQSLPPVDQFGSALWSTLSELLKPLQTLHDPEAAFAHFAGYQALCAHRTGPYGSVMVNALLEEALARHFNLPAEQRWHVGRPIVITENDYAVDLFNGDTGILLPWKGKLAAFFRSPEGGFRQIPPARLPAHESAYALTIHKSQGSEFDQVLLILTDQASPILSRELLYTGITRARSRVEVWGTSESLQACVERPLKRTLHLESHCPAPANPSLASS
jgi:exodeoxyribonuclease V alpha subunit